MTDASGAAPGGDLPARPDASVPSAGPANPPMTESGTVFQSHVRAARSEFENQVAHARAEFEEANERIKERTGRDLIVATLIGVAAGATLIASLIFFKELFIVFALAASTLGILELHRAMVGAGRRVDVVPQLIAGTALVLAGYFFDPWLLWVTVFVAVAFVVIWRMIGQMAAGDGRTYGDVLGDVLIAALVQLYVPFLAAVCLVLLRQEGGEWWVLSFIAIAVACDVGAYVAGLSFGKHPMAPRISPKKTWEGFAGAVVAAVIAGILLAMFLLHLPIWAGVVLGLLILATATVGDLGESMIKRDIGIKDMSSWLPGHGGVLDRLDSILPSTTAALALYYLLTPLASS